MVRVTVMNYSSRRIWNKKKMKVKDLLKRNRAGIRLPKNPRVFVDGKLAFPNQIIDDESHVTIVPQFVSFTTAQVRG
jgi:hypothetical protein